MKRNKKGKKRPGNQENPGMSRNKIVISGISGKKHD